MEQILYFEKDRFAGRTHFCRSMFRDAVHLAASRVEGVDHVCSDRWFRFWHLFRLLFRRNGTNGGVAIRAVDYNTYIVYVCLTAVHGYSAADIAYRVQEAILDVACNKRLTDKKIKRVDVTICGVKRKCEGGKCE